MPFYKDSAFYNTRVSDYIVSYFNISIESTMSKRPDLTLRTDISDDL